MGFLAGLLGGLVVVAGMHLMEEEPQPQSEYISPLKTVPITTREVIPSQDLTVAAELTMPAVVHIKAAESETRARERYFEKTSRNGNSVFTRFRNGWLVIKWVSLTTNSSWQIGQKISRLEYCKVSPQPRQVEGKKTSQKNSPIAVSEKTITH